MFKFEQPRPTKSGKKSVEIWKELKRTWRKYKMAQLQSDLPKMREYAMKIRDLQEDFGITQAEFPELTKFKVKIKN